MHHVGPVGPELPSAPLSMSTARASVLEALRARPGSSTVREVADDLDLHPNTVREHLDALVTARLVVRQEATPTGRGRPALLYRAMHDAGDVARDYELLAGVFAAHIAEQPDAEDNSLRAGRAWGRELVAGAPGSDVVEVLDELGFEPTEPDEDGGVVLRACPVLDVARRHPEVVCTAHLGMTQVLVEHAGLRSDDVDLLPMAAPNGCVLRLPRAASSTELAG